jgi:beta-1,4-mannosyl-glycoprotein beta-1,4-N-acetylglucosaminyltransferase
MLLFRLEYLYDTIDHFVLVEATRTHAGNPKPLYFEQNKASFSKYLDKIIHVIVDDMPLEPPIKLSFLKSQSTPHWNDIHWKRENHQRNCIDRGIRQLSLHPDDIILISDVDEIPNKHNLHIGAEIYSLEQDMYYYNFHTKSRDTWTFAKVLTYRAYAGKTPQQIRFEQGIIIPNGGWHFSYFGDVNFIRNKLQNFAHQEHKHIQPSTIEEKINSNADLFGKHERFVKTTLVPETLPEHYEMLL